MILYFWYFFAVIVIILTFIVIIKGVINRMKNNSDKKIQSIEKRLDELERKK